MARTRFEVEDDLKSVRAAIKSAEKAQSYSTGLGNRRDMASLEILYKREERLLSERSALATGGGYAGMVRNVGRIAR